MSGMRRLEGFSGFIEAREGLEARPEISHVVFDFDGTLSLIREGWPAVMIPMMVEYLPRKEGETEAEAEAFLFDDIMALTGKQTIYQMIQFAERVTERGGEPEDPLWYKHEYLRRLEARIESRLRAIEAAPERRVEFLVHESEALLDLLVARGMTLYLASGTDEVYVKREASLLGLDRYFGDRIYGALDDYKSFSKKMVIERILKENAIDGRRLLGIGDGYVEIENTKEAGGLTIGVIGDEAKNGSGEIDEWKRDRLTGVGADVLAPDYRDARALIELVTGKRVETSVD